VITQPRPSPAIIAEQLRNEIKKQTTDWDQVCQWARKCPDVCNEADFDGWLPLHVACANEAPLDVIQSLAVKWSDAVKGKQEDGWLPLHVACKENAPLDVIKFLVEEWRDAVRERETIMNGFPCITHAKEMHRSM
jgi:ankyrin repeat protein